MEETLRTSLIELASRFETAANVTPATVAKRALNDNTFFARIGDGKTGFNIRTFDRLVQWFAENWPEGAEWPASVPFPDEPTPSTQSEPVEKVAC